MGKEEKIEEDNIKPILDNYLLINLQNWKFKKQEDFSGATSNLKL